jgi:DNA-binding XRE family transcriptional regulator
MKKKTPGRCVAKKRKQRRERDLAVLAGMGVVVVESPNPGYVHPLVRALARTIRAWRIRHRMRLSSVARRANLSREALRKLEKGDVWYSINVAVRVCDAMGLEWLEANTEACRRFIGWQAKKCQL